MNFPRFSMVFVFVWLTLSACDDGGKKTVTQPSLSLSTIHVGPVKYQLDPKGLAAEVTVHVVDDAGAPLPQVAVHLESLLDQVSTVLPGVQVTDASGDAVFTVVGTGLGTADLLAHVSTDPADTFEDLTGHGTLDATAQAVFDFEAGVMPMDAAYTWDQGDFTLRVSLQDATGPIPDAGATVQTDEADLEFDGSPIMTYTTNTSGTFTLHATTPRSGLQEVRVSLDGVDGAKAVNVDFYGPRVSGTVYLDQIYPLGFRSARVAAMGLNMTDRVTIDLGAPILAQAASESVCPCPSPAGFELTLPIVPPEAMLNTDAAGQVKYNYFPIVVYDDLNDDYVWNEGEPLLAARLNAGILHYAMPDGANPAGTLGWKLVDVIADEPVELDWDFFNESMDAWIRRSPVTEIHLSGTDDSGYDTARMAFYVVNAAAMTGYTPSMAWVTSMFDQVHGAGQFLPIVDVPVSGGTYDATVLAPEFTGSQAQDWEITWTTGNGDTVKGYLVIPFIYSDDNGNGTFDAAETLLGTVSSPFGTAEVVFYITEYPNYELFRDPTRLGLHLGYNRILVPAVLEIQSHMVDAGAQIFTFNVNLPDQLVDVPFQVVADGDLISSPPVATGTFSTFSAGNTLSVPSSTCTNCGNTGAGDSFIILAPLDLGRRNYLDWTEMNFTTGRP